MKINTPQEIYLTLTTNLLPKGTKFKEKCTFPNYSFENGGACKNGGYTRFINTCSALELLCINGKESTTVVHHFAPEMKDTYLRSKLAELCKSLMGNNEKVHALIVGGAKSLRDNESFNLMAMIGEVVDTAGINLSMLGSKKPQFLKSNVAAVNNNFRVELTDSELISEKIKNIGKSPNQEQIKKILEEAFEIVEIHDGHKLNFEI